LRPSLYGRDDVAQVGRRTFGSSEQHAASPTAGLVTDDECRRIRELPPQPLRTRYFWRPARVVEPREAQVVQPCRSQPGSAKRGADHLAAISEESLNSVCIELSVGRADTTASARK